MHRPHMTFVCFALVLLLGISFASSQNKFGIGLRTGLNFGTMSFTPDITQQNPQITQGGRTTFLIGAAGEYNFSKMFAAELGLVFTGKGATYTLGNANQTFKWSELDIPILFKVKFLEGKIRPYALAGPNIGLVLSATSTLENPPNPPQDIDFKSGSPNYYSAGTLDFALEFGGGAEYKVTKNIGIFLDVRYSVGLSNLVSLPSGTQAQPGTTEPSWKASGLMLQVGSFYYF